MTGLHDAPSSTENSNKKGTPDMGVPAEFTLHTEIEPTLGVFSRVREYGEVS